jgi:hypothetical protein
MHTLFDFVSNVNAMQYGLALLFVLGFIIFTEILKARPFEELVQSAAEDVKFIKAQGKEKNIQLVKNIASAPLYLVTYLVAVPFLFIQGMTEPLTRGFGSLTTAGWSPVRAYFTGNRKAKKTKGKDSGSNASH